MKHENYSQALTGTSTSLVWVEHIALPVLFLTVALAGGMRFAAPNHQLVFVTPPVMSVVLGAILMAVIARARLLVLPRYIGEDRSWLENATGITRLLSIFLASVQVLHLVTPERGLLNFLFNVFFLLIFWNNWLITFHAVRLLRSLAVLLGASFLLKFVLLADLLAPAESWAKSIVQGLLQVGSLGTLEYEVFAPATGYLGLGTLLLYLLGLYLVSRSHTQTEEVLDQILSELPRLTSEQRRRLLSAAGSGSGGSEYQ